MDHACTKEIASIGKESLKRDRLSCMVVPVRPTQVDVSKEVLRVVSISGTADGRLFFNFEDLPPWHLLNWLVLQVGRDFLYEATTIYSN